MTAWPKNLMTAKCLTTPRQVRPSLQRCCDDCKEPFACISRFGPEFGFPVVAIKKFEKSSGNEGQDIMIRDPFPYSFFRTKSSSVITLTSSSCLIKEQMWQKQLFVSEGLRLESMKRMNQTLQPFIAVSDLPEDHSIFPFPPSVTGMTSHIYDDQQTIYFLKAYHSSQLYISMKWSSFPETA